MRAASLLQLAALIAGDDAAWGAWSEDPGRLVSAATAHGVLPLIADRAIQAGAGCPREVRAALQDEARRIAAVDLVREQELRVVVAALHDAGVEALLMKGADLAYSRYARPDLRARLDSDLLVRPAHRDVAAATLVSLGYERVPQSGGDLLMYQEPFRLRRDGMDRHIVDLHWRVSNTQRFGAAFDFEGLAASAEPRPQLGPDARGLGPVDALLIAGVHRIAHHFDDDRLIWSHDVHVLASGLSSAAWAQFAAEARRRSIEGACLRSLENARRLFDTDVPATVMAGLEQGSRHEAGNAPFFDRSVPHAARVWSDVQHVPSWRGRLRLMRQHAFPPARYMRDVYAPASPAPLWMLYLRRIVSGSRRWLSRS